jgi:hypothetical protein
MTSTSNVVKKEQKKSNVSEINAYLMKKISFNINKDTEKEETDNIARNLDFNKLSFDNITETDFQKKIDISIFLQNGYLVDIKTPINQEEVYKVIKEKLCLMFSQIAADKITSGIIGEEDENNLIMSIVKGFTSNAINKEISKYGTMIDSQKNSIMNLVKELIALPISNNQLRLSVTGIAFLVVSLATKSLNTFSENTIEKII